MASAPRDAVEVEAAGGIVSDGNGAIAVVYRPDRRDWSLPKGKLEPGERRKAAARREVFEETGMVCDIVGRAADVTYVDRHSRTTRVRYSHMVRRAGRFTENAETSELRWIRRDEVGLLTYETDVELVLAHWPAH